MTCDDNVSDGSGFVSSQDEDRVMDASEEGNASATTTPV